MADSERPLSAADLRRRAEERLAELTAPSPMPGDAADVVHELRVHQVELELQNEELRRTGLELDAERAKYFDLFDLAPVGYLTLTDKNIIGDANLTATRLLGAERRQLVGRPLSSFVLAADQTDYYLHRTLLARTGEPQSCELRLLRTDAEPFWALLEWQPQVAVDGKPITSRVTFTDISARKQGEEALRQREREFSTLVENAPDMIVRFDADLRHVYCNAAVERQLGVPPRMFIGKTPLEIGAPREQAEFAWQALRQALETGREQVVEQSYPSPSGQKHLLTRIVPERDEQGSIGSLLAITRDITERKRAEEELRQVTDRLSLAVRAGGVGVWDYDPASGALVWDDQMYRLYGICLLYTSPSPRDS